MMAFSTSLLFLQVLCRLRPLFFLLFALVFFLVLVPIMQVTLFIFAVTFFSPLTLLPFFGNHRLEQAMVLFMPTPHQPLGQKVRDSRLAESRRGRRRTGARCRGPYPPLVGAGDTQGG